MGETQAVRIHAGQKRALCAARGQSSRLEQRQSRADQARPNQTQTRPDQNKSEQTGITAGHRSNGSPESTADPGDWMDGSPDMCSGRQNVQQRERTLTQAPGKAPAPEWSWEESAPSQAADLRMASRME